MPGCSTAPFTSAGWRRWALFPALVTILAGATSHGVGSSYLLCFKDNKWGLREVNFTWSHGKGQSHDLIWACLMAEPGLTTVCHSASPHPRSGCPSRYQSQKWAWLQIPPFLQLMQILTSDCTKFRDSLGFNPQPSNGLCPVPRILYCRGRNHASTEFTGCPAVWGPAHTFLGATFHEEQWQEEWLGKWLDGLWSRQDLGRSYLLEEKSLWAVSKS